MKKLAVLAALTLSLVAVALLGSTSASAAPLDQAHGYVYGAALNNDGSFCSGCEIYAQDLTQGGLHIGISATGTNICSGNWYNWGTFSSGSSCFTYNPGTFHFTWPCNFPCVWDAHTITVRVWARKHCPTNGGYYYSPTSDWVLSNGNQRFTGSQRLQDPNTGCFVL